VTAYSRSRPANHWVDWPATTYGVVGSAEYGNWDSEIYAQSQVAYNVKSAGYAAAGNGSTDDTVAIQAALTDARVAGGGTVYLPPGTYIISSGLVIGDNTRLDGNATIKYKTDASNAGFIGVSNYDTTNGNTNIAISNLTIDGNKTGRASDTASHLIRIISADAHSCTNIRIQNNRLINPAFAAIQLMNVVGGHVTGNTIDETGRDSITVWFNSSDIQISGNVITNSGDDCIALNSEVTSHSGTQIARVSITGNTCQQDPATLLGSGIRIAGALDVTCTGNTIGYTQGWGILIEGGFLTGSSMPSQRVSVTGNTIRAAGTSNSGAGGIATSQSSSAITINGNIVGGYYSNGIQLATKALVSNNYVGTGQTSSSVGIYANSTYVVMSGNQIDQTQSNGVQIANEKCIVTGNTFFECCQQQAGGAYVVVNAGVNRAVVNGNTFQRTSHGTYGVRLATGAGTGHVVTGNIGQGFAGGNEFSDGTSGTNVIANNSTI
jgi:putative cofactor-binding repeat protein